MSALVLSACAPSSMPSAGNAGGRRSPPVDRTTTSVASTTTSTDPGALPQTDAIPRSDTPQFAEEMAALWQGVTAESVATALASFFPEQAYVQVKAIADPEADYQNRLVAELGLDLGAAHALLGVNPSTAQLLGVNVPGEFAHWVPPGTCDNRVGYYEVPNSRVVYRTDGETRSFGIASLISWRGVWYVVHLGAVVRTGHGGEVDDPQAGPGTSAPSSTC